jgi:hypothetical protein
MFLLQTAETTHKKAMIEEILSDLSPPTVALGSGLFLAVLFFVMKFRVAWQIHNLGGKAPEIPSYFPVGELLYSCKCTCSHIAANN